MRKTFHRCCLCLLTLLLAGMANGEEAARQFDVELVIFAHLNAYDGGEVWPAGEDRTLSRSAWDESPETGSWTRLPDSGGRLTAVADALQRSGSYRPLAHLRWRQPVMAPDTARAIDIGALLDDRTANLSGTLRLSVSRYLHLETDLRLTDTRAGYEQDVPVYRLQQSRRMRSGELHYIDHPRFAVLAVITPYTPAE